MSRNRNQIPFKEVLEALLDLETHLKPRYLTRLSDIEPEDLDELKKIWFDIPLWRRQALLEDIEELSSKNTLYSFVEFCHWAVSDPDPRVRYLAIQTLWDYEDYNLIPTLLRLAENDADISVRANATGALGRYVLAGELDLISRTQLREIEEKLIKLLSSDQAENVQRAALEALGYSGREEIPAFIEQALQSADEEWIASALFAISRSGEKSWKRQVLSFIDHHSPTIRSEAARAAGELEIKDAVPELIELLDDPDDETRTNSIWSLSQIGGEGVSDALEKLLEESDDQNEIDLILDALDNLNFNQGISFFPLFDFPENLEEDEFEYFLDTDEPDEM